MQYEQRSPEWFAARVGRVTGSVIGAILGLSPHMTPDDVIRSMVRAYHGAPSEFTGNVATDWGNANEAGAALDYELDTGRKVETAYFVPFRDALGASPDGYVGEDGLIEIKCPYGKREIEDNSEFDSIDDQPHYYAQIQVQLLCTGRTWCDFYQWAPKAQKLERVNIDPEWLRENLPKLREFHNRYLAELDDPKHLTDTRKVITDESALTLVEEYHKLREEAKEAEDRMKAILLELHTAHGESQIGKSKLTRVERKGNVSYAKVIKDHLSGLDLEPYRGKASVHWRLS